MAGLPPPTPDRLDGLERYYALTLQCSDAPSSFSTIYSLVALTSPSPITPQGPPTPTRPHLMLPYVHAVLESLRPISLAYPEKGPWIDTLANLVEQVLNVNAEPETSSDESTFNAGLLPPLLAFASELKPSASSALASRLHPLVTSQGVRVARAVLSLCPFSETGLVEFVRGYFDKSFTQFTISDFSKMSSLHCLSLHRLSGFDAILDFYDAQEANSDTPEFLSMHLEALLISKSLRATPRVWSTVLSALSSYNLQDAQLGYGSWVPDTKSNGRGSSSVLALPSDPTVLRRRAMALRVGGEEWEAYWDAWHVAEMEYQPHLISPIFRMPLPYSPRHIELLHTRLLYSDSPQVRKMALAKSPPGGSASYVKAKVECLESLRGRHSTTHVEGSASTDLQLVVREAMAGRCMEDPSSARELLCAVVDPRITSLGVLGVLDGLGGAPALEGVDAVEVSHHVKTRSHHEPKVVRDDLALGLASVLSKTSHSRVSSAWDVVYVLSAFPPPFPPPSGDVMPDLEPPPWFGPLQSFLSNLPNSFSVSAAPALAQTYVSSGPSGTSGSPSYALCSREAASSLTLLSLLTTGCAEALWPPIMKALRGASVRAYVDAGQVDRAVELLCAAGEMRGLGGSGNGDLVVTRDGGMMAPPPAVETALGEAGAHLRKRLASEECYRPDEGEMGGTSQSLGKGDVAGRMLQFICGAFPSSVVLGEMVERMKEEGAKGVEESLEGAKAVPHLKALSISLRCNASFPVTKAPAQLEQLLSLMFKSSASLSSSAEQRARSAFQLSKWDTLSSLSERVFSETGSGTISLAQSTADAAFDDLENSNLDVLPHLFNAACCASKALLSSGASPSSKAFERIAEGAWSMVMEEARAAYRAKMAERYCSLVFSSEAMAAFPEAVKGVLDKLLNGRSRSPLLGRCAVMHLCKGLKAVSNLVPWRDVVCDLVQHKEERIKREDTVETGSAYDEFGFEGRAPESSLTRAIALEYINGLDEARLGEAGVKDLPQYMIRKLLKEAGEGDANGRDQMMIGTYEYCRKLRSWQALCLLDRFVADDMAAEVASLLYEGNMGRMTHAAIRFFMEAFGIRTLRKNPEKCAPYLLKALRKLDLTAQVQSSLLTIAGYGLVGNVRASDVRKYLNSAEVVAAVTPWLGSTQGFSRGIAQMLLFELLPSVMGVGGYDEANGTYLSSLYGYLTSNRDVVKLRKKTGKFFAKLDVDSRVTLEGLLTREYDTNEDPMPDTLVEMLKGTMKELFEETHGGVETRLNYGRGLGEVPGVPPESKADGPSPFQRKILPFDALNIAASSAADLLASNAAGSEKQDLIICAALIDKPPNLGGLARTCEIFAARSLIVPDIRVVKMDNFKATSVASHDWVDIQECKEENLPNYLLSLQSEGYSIIGVEQCSTSSPLSTLSFPKKSCVLLGDEKKGLSPSLLGLCDALVEIPQWGVTRSLNVHVCGALVAWEYTKQRTEGKAMVKL